MATTKDISAEFRFESNVVEVHGSKMHYIDVGEGDPILFLLVGDGGPVNGAAGGTGFAVLGETIIAPPRRVMCR